MDRKKHLMILMWSFGVLRMVALGRNLARILLSVMKGVSLNWGAEPSKYLSWLIYSGKWSSNSLCWNLNILLKNLVSMLKEIGLSGFFLDLRSQVFFYKYS